MTREKQFQIFDACCDAFITVASFVLFALLIGGMLAIPVSLFAAEPSSQADDLQTFVKTSVSRVVVRHERVCFGTHCEVRPVYAVQVTRAIEAAPVTLASRPELPDNSPSVNSQVILTSSRVTASTCNCADTGRCLCDFATCRCPSCPTGRAQAVAANSAVHAAPACSVSQFASPRGPVTLEKTATGDAVITHPGGHYGRQLARHLARGVRLGVN